MCAHSHIFTNPACIFAISVGIWVEHMANSNHVLMQTHILTHLKKKTLMEYEHRQCRTHSRTCCMLPTPVCVDLPAFLANLQHNGTPVSSKSLLPPQKQSLRECGGRGGVAKYILQQTPGSLFKIVSFFQRLSLLLPLLMSYRRIVSVFQPCEVAASGLGACYHSNRHKGYYHSQGAITGKRWE